jgi:uncharacterized oligopeptide transporter (OPT) family protein
MVSALHQLWLAHTAVYTYAVHLEQEEKSNASKIMVKVVYFLGITLSLLVSLWIMDRYVKRQLEQDKERQARGEEERKKIEAEVREQYLKTKEAEK